MAKPKGDVGVVFAFKYDVFTRGNGNPRKQVFICLSKARMNRVSEFL